MGRSLLNLATETRATLVVIEHDVPLVSGFSDELVCMDLGRVIARGRPAEVLADREVIVSYLGGNQSAATV